MADKVIPIKATTDFPLPLRKMEMKPRYDLNPDWIMFRMETDPPPDKDHAYLMPTKFDMAGYRFEAVEDYPTVDGWFMTKRTKLEGQG